MSYIYEREEKISEKVEREMHKCITQINIESYKACLNFIIIKKSYINVEIVQNLLCYSWVLLMINISIA